MIGIGDFSGGSVRGGSIDLLERPKSHILQERLPPFPCSNTFLGAKSQCMISFL